jgi:AcrR family transcriptional regulator
MPRTYKQKKRAESQDETRARIVDATIVLHQEIGGPATTVKAIAERAGVERATVYRHFPDERALLQACTGHYIMQNPPPLPEMWLQIENAEERLQAALTQIYDYHRHNEVMLARAVIDIPQMPTLREVMEPFFAYWAHVKDVLAAAWCRDGREKPLVAAAIGHAISFETWQSLVRMQGLENAEAVLVMVKMVRCVAKL